MEGNVKMGKKKRTVFNFYAVMILMALIPIITASSVITQYLITKSSNEISSIMQDYMYSLAYAKGDGLTNKIDNIGEELGLSVDVLTGYCSTCKIENVESSYCYVADANATMLYHPTAEKIGEPVTNEVIQNVCAQMLAGDTVENACVSYTYNGVIKYAAYYVDPQNRFVFVISADEEDVLSEANLIKSRGYMIAVLLDLLFVFIAIYSARGTIIPLKSIKDELTTISKGDFTQEVTTTSIVKEVNEIIDATRTLQEALIEALGTVNAQSDTLSGAIENVSERIENSVGGVAQINAAVGEVATTSQHVAEEAQVLNEKAIEMGDEIENIYESISALQEASARIDTINNEANDSMSSVMKSGEESVDAVHAIADKIKETNEAVTRITECVQMITDISSQTNLLSLNASIEAARAGEAGKGFAVVAEEIRKLADDSAASAREIEEIIATVTALSESTVEAVEGVFEVIDGEQAFVKETQDKFGALSNAVEDSLNSINEIQSMSQGLTKIKEELVSSTTDLSAVSEELGASAEEVSASCSTVTDECENAANETNTMASSKKDLQDAISIFEI